MKPQMLITIALGLITLSLFIVGCGTAAPLPANTPTSVALRTPVTAPTFPPVEPTETRPPLPTSPPPAQPSAAPSPTTAPAAATSPTPGAAACTNNATFISDVTIPDNSAVAAGQTFVKIWRVRNTGTCTWGSDYQLAFVRDETMGTARALSVTQTAPGANADLQVTLTAPTNPGTYRSTWRLRTPTGTFFGPTVFALVRVGSTPAQAPPIAIAPTTGLALFVSNIELIPTQPSFNEPIGFRVTLNNAAGTEQTVRWFVKAYQCTRDPCPEDDLKNSIGESTVVESTLAPGTNVLIAPQHWSVNPGTTCTHVAVAHYFEPVGQGIVPFLQTNGERLFHVFNLCR